MLLYLAGMSAIDPSLEEAARIDGAGWLRILFSVIVPNLRRVLEIVLVVNTITAFAFMFTYIYTITNGGPGTDTYVTEFYIYQQAFTESEHGLRGRDRRDARRHRPRRRAVPDPHPHERGAADVRRRHRSRRRRCTRPDRRRRSRRYSWPLVVGIGLFCASAVLPLLFMAATAFRTQADWANSKIGLPTTLSLRRVRAGLDGREYRGLLPQLRRS